MPSSTLTLRDIAAMAGVRRPVVSTWRNRPSVRGQRVDFPTPVGSDRGVEHFDRADVEQYLATTGRGNNAEAGLDAAAFVVPDAPYDELVTLLFLRTQCGDVLADIDLVGRSLRISTWARRRAAPPRGHADRAPGARR